VFPPIPIIPKVIGKLKADRAHGVALVPYRPDTAWWTTIEQACEGDAAIIAVETARAVDLTALTERSVMYAGVNWRLCRFNFGSDRPWCYAEQCGATSPWSAPTVSPADLDHQRRLHALRFRLEYGSESGIDSTEKQDG
jgi:hypothetical protein